MRTIAATMVLAALTVAAHSKVYYVNRGVKYHLGDSRFAKSEHAKLVGAHPVIGREWVQAFTVDSPDKVKVRIEKIWGVDDCRYCKILISIDDTDMGRLFAENNEKPFDTPEPLAKQVEPGKVHVLKIASIGLQADDFVIEDIVVETDRANLTLLKPGPVVKNPDEPMPKLVAPSIPPRNPSPCEKLEPVREWLPGFDEKGGKAVTVEKKEAFQQTDTLAAMKAGERLDLDFRLKSSGLDGNRVEQALEILVSSKELTGWALLFEAGGTALRHANPVENGDYVAWRGGLPRTAASGWNSLSLRYCRAGMVGLYLNGKYMGSVSAPDARLAVSARGMGLEMEIKPKQG